MKNGLRYSFDLSKRRVWRDMFKPWFWRMWGIPKTLKYMIQDTFGRG
jgi:hypothetical protein